MITQLRERIADTVSAPSAAGAGIAALFVLSLVGCGGNSSSPSGPSTTTTTPTPSTSTPAVVSVVSGETGAGVSTATAVVSGQSVRSDAQGQVPVPSSAGPGAFIDVLAAGFFDRQTTLRTGTSSARLSLWPRSSPTGLDENTTALLVYTSTNEGSMLGGLGLRRHKVGTDSVSLILSAGLMADSAAVARHQLSADLMTAATGGRVAYRIVAQAPASGVAVNVSYEPGNSTCDDRTRGFTTVRTSASEITSASIVYCVADAPRSPTVLHELGHTFGLLHSPNRTDVMFSTIVSDRSEVLTARETLAMRLMLDRAAGTRFPDNDRDTSGLTSHEANGVQLIRCKG